MYRAWRQRRITNGEIPEGFDVISLPAAEYLAVQGEPFREEDYSQAILAVQYASTIMTRL